jgi:hypothetical protein
MGLQDNSSCWNTLERTPFSRRGPHLPGTISAEGTRAILGIMGREPDGLARLRRPRAWSLGGIENHVKPFSVHRSP